MHISRKQNWLDIVLMLSLLALTGWYLAQHFDFKAQPAEDAAMLMRYAGHLAQGHGIVWNIGEPPVDGATDFLFMAVLAGLNRAGLPLESAVHTVDLGAHLLTVWIVYLALRRVQNCHPALAWLAAAFLALGPGSSYAEAYFGTPFFALFAALTWAFATWYVSQPRPTGYAALLFALSGLLMGLTRPEGVLFAGFMLAAILLRRGWKDARLAIGYFVLVFGVLGSAYFFWRWSYFGHPLPNPFYKKGNGRLFWGNLSTSFNNVMHLATPFNWVYLYALLLLVTHAVERAVIQYLWRPLQPVLARLAARPAGWQLSATRLQSLLRLLAALLLLTGLLGALRTSSSLHASLILGRYSAQYFALLLILLSAGVLLWFLAMPSINLGRRAVHAIHQALTGLSERPAAHDMPGAPAFTQQVIFAFLPLAGFTAMWVLLSDEMNYIMRFQYPLLAVLLIAVPPLLPALWNFWKLPPWRELDRSRTGALWLLVIAAAGLILNTQVKNYGGQHTSLDGRYEMANMLADYRQKGYTIATSEAGLLPFYSGWRAIDTWGLNDAWIAHNGRITAEYLQRYRPELILFHADFSPIAPPRSTQGDAWFEMTITLKQYAEQNGYLLAAVYGQRPTDTHYYYVRPDFADSAEIVRRIRENGYPPPMNTDYTRIKIVE